MITAQKVKFSIRDFFSKCDQIRRKLRIWSQFTEEILNGKLHFLCSGYFKILEKFSFWFNQKLQHPLMIDAARKIL